MGKKIRHQHSSNQQENETGQIRDDLARRIGRNVRELRKAMHMSLGQLARETELSPALLSRIENGLIMPSLMTLQVLANYLKVDIAYLFREEDEKGFVVTRTGKRRFVESNRGQYVVERLIEGMENPFMEPAIVTTPVGGADTHLAQHNGQEFCYCLEGKLELTLGDRKIVLNRGDAAYFRGEIPHGGRSLSKKPARSLNVHMILGSRFGTFENPEGA